MKKILTMILLVLCLTLTGCKEKTNINENNKNNIEEASNIRLAENIAIYNDSETWKYSTYESIEKYYLTKDNSYSPYKEYGYTIFTICLNDSGDRILVKYELKHNIKYYIESINENSYIVYKYDVFIRQTPQIELLKDEYKEEDNSKHTTRRNITLSELKELYDIDSYTDHVGIQQFLDYCEKIDEILIEEKQTIYFYNVSAVVIYAEE